MDTQASKLEQLIKPPVTGGFPNSSHGLSGETDAAPNMKSLKAILEYHKLLCDHSRDLMRRKSNDYAGEDGENTFRNFEICSRLGVTTTEQGILVRLTDKVSRLASFSTQKTMLVDDERYEDTILDLINYAVVLAAWRRTLVIP